jgi:general L-amino acid transport system substrate-binding protein
LIRLAMRAVLLALLLIPHAHADSGDTLRLVRARGTLRCGVSEGITGFSARTEAGWAGIDIDFCRAAAAAILGDPAKVQFMPLRATARFPALATREIDILARNTTWTVAREAIFSTIFVGALYIDSQVLIVRADGPFAHGEPLQNARICVEKGTNQQDTLRAYASEKNWTFTPVIAPELGTARKDFLTGLCPILTDDRSALVEMLLSVPDPSAYVIRADIISNSPLGPAVRWEDGQWLALIRAVYAALIDAETRGFTQAQARAFPRAPTDATHRAYLAETAPLARATGIAPTWAVQAVAAAGNYGEIFNRNVGAASKLKLDRGPNRPWTQGGALFAPPFE